MWSLIFSAENFRVTEEESLIISLGYTFSNLDPLLSGVRETVFDGKRLDLGKKRPFFHSLSTGIGWRF